MLEFFLIMTIVFAVLALQAHSLRRAVIYSSVYSLLFSICYLMYKAPDVAIAEAVIGCTLSTALFLVALKKFKVFRVYLTTSNNKSDGAVIIKNTVVRVLSEFSSDSELEMDLIYTNESTKDILAHQSYDLIFEQRDEEVRLYGDNTNYHFDRAVDYFREKYPFDIDFHGIKTDEGDVDL